MIPTIHYILRIERPTPDGSVAVYMRVTFNRKQIITLSMGKTIPLKKEFQNLQVDEIKKISTDQRYDLYCWDKEKERSVRGFGSMEKFNFFLDDERKRANDILFDLHKRERLTPENFKKEFLKLNNTPLTFLEYSQNELNKSRSEQFRYDTKRSYKSIIVKLDSFKPGIKLTDITYKFLIEYENYLLKSKEEGGAGNAKCTVEKNMKVIRTFICMAIKNGDFPEKDYPFKDYKIKETEKSFSTRDFLEPEEILMLEKLYFNFIPLEKELSKMSGEDWCKRREIGVITPGEHKALHAFLIGIYTGLRFHDVLSLNSEKHLKSKYVSNPKTGERSLKYYIEIDAHKNGKMVIIPLIEKAMKLIDVNKPGKLCYSSSNQKINEHIRCIQKKAGIQKQLTFHVSRHSFATVAFDYDIPQKIVQSILGHRNKKFTEIYTHLSGKKLFFEMDKMNKGYSDMEILLNECNSSQISKNNMIAKLQNLDEKKIKKLVDLLEVL